MDFIVMLTNNDQTVKDAIEVFDSAKDLDVQHWGFKDVGLPVPEMKKLVKNMKDAGKTTYLEVVSYEEDECKAAAELAMECDFDWLMGTIYYPSVGEMVKGKIKYMPFCGRVWGSPSKLGDEIDGIIEDANRLKGMGVEGINLLAFRFIGDPLALIDRFVKEIVDIPICLAGSINSYERLDLMKKVNPDFFTMGSALFAKKFVPDGSFRDNLKAVADYIK